MSSSIYIRPDNVDTSDYDDAALTSAVSEIRTNISQTNSTVDDLASIVNSQATTITQTSNKVDTLQTSVASVESVNHTQDTNINTHNNNITYLTTNSLSHAASITSLINKDVSNQNKFTLIDGEIATLQGYHGTHSTRIASVESKVAEIQNDPTIATNAASIALIQGQITNQFSSSSIHVNNITSDANILNINTTGVNQVMNIGTSGITNTINIGNSTTQVNMVGKTNIIEQIDLAVNDKTITLNKNGTLASAFSSGIELEENNSIVGYVKTSSDRSRWELKAPANASIFRTPISTSGDAGKFLRIDSSGNTLWDFVPTSSATATGNQGSIQYNNGGALAGSNIITDGTNIQVGKVSSTNNQLILNKDGGVSSSSGIYIEESGINVGYAKITADRSRWELKAPNSSSLFRTPLVQGLSGQVLKTDGNNTSYWDYETVGSTATQGLQGSLQYNNSGVLGGSNLITDGNNLTVNGILTANELNVSSFTNLSNIVNAASSSPVVNALVKYDASGNVYGSKLIASNRVETATMISPNGTLYLGAQSGSIVNIGSSSSTINLTGNVGNIMASDITANKISPTSIDTETINSTSGIMNIGASAGSTINIGSSTSNVNIVGTLNNIVVNDLFVKDKTIVLNKGGAIGSAVGSGIFFEEGGSIASGYMKISDDRNRIELKAHGGPSFNTPLSAANSNGNIFYGLPNGNTAYASSVYTNGIGDLNVGNRLMINTSQNAGTLNVGGGLIALYPNDSTSGSGMLFYRDIAGGFNYFRVGLGLNTTFATDFSIGTVNGSALSVANSSRNVGILKDNAAYPLDVNGQIKSNAGLLPNSNGTAGQVLTSDGIGNISWNNASAPSQNVRVIGTYITGHVYDMLSTDNVIVFSVYYTSSAPTINLLSPSSVGAGKTITIKDGTGYACQLPITLTTALSSGLIDGSVSNTIQLSNSYGSITLVSTGSKWVVIDKSSTMGKFMAYQKTSQSIPDRSSTAISFNEVLLRSGMFADNNFFTPYDNNQYFRNSLTRNVVWSITANVRFSNLITSSDNALAINIGPSPIVNTSEIEPATQLAYCNNSPFAGNPSATVVVPGGYYVWISCYQASGSAQPLMISKFNCQIQIVQLG